MANFKVVGKIDKGDGIENYEIFVRECENEDQAETIAKHWFIDRPHLGVYYGAKSVTKI